VWIGVKNSRTGAAITNAYFNYDYQNYSASGYPGWYWVAVPQYAYLTAYAWGYNSATGYTNGYDSFNVYLQPTTTTTSGW
jgi:hypothetical protein